MPLPWLFNQWACNPFAAEPDREATLALEAVSIGFATRPEDIVATPLPPGDEAHYRPEDWFASLTADWPTVANVVPRTEQVLEGHFDEVLAFVTATEGQAPEKLECFDYAHFQLYEAGYRPSGSPARSPESFLVLHEYREGDAIRTEVQVERMVDAIDYLKATLLEETPVLIGVRLNGWSKRPNELKSTPYIEPTNHYVVAVGMGTDDEGCYITYFDYLVEYTSRSQMYLRPTLLMETRSGHRSLTEVRRSRPR